MAQRHLGKTATAGRRSERPSRVRARPQPAATDDVSVAPQQLLALFAANDLEAFIDIGFSLLRAAVPCDFVSAVYRNAGNGLLKERDSRGRGYGVAFMRRYAELTPAIPLVMSSPGIKVLTTRTGLPASTKELQSTAFYREIMRPQGWRHGVSLCFWGDRPAELPILVAVAYRREGRRDFSEHDVVALTRIHPFLDCAVNRLCEREAAKTLHDGTAMMVCGGALGFALLDQNLLLVQANLVARRLCAAWMDDGHAHAEDPSLTWRTPPAPEPHAGNCTMSGTRSCAPIPTQPACAATVG